MDKIGDNAHDNGDWADAKLIHVADPNAADKSELKQTLDIAKALKEADYTVESYKALQEAIQNAETVYADKTATQEAVDAQATALQAAVQGLKVPDASDYQGILKKLQAKEAELAKKQEELANTKGDKTELQKELQKIQDDLKELEKAKDAAYKKLQEEKATADEALKQAQAEIERLKAQQNQNQPKPEEALKVGDTVTSGNVKYRVTDAQKKLAEAYGVDSRRARTLKVAAAVTINGETVSVTSIAANAFKGMKKLEKVTIGTNVSRIGKNAFSGDSKLKSIQIKSKKLTSVGKRALKNISAKAVIKVPKSKKKAYTSLLKGKGQKKSVKIK